MDRNRAAGGTILTAAGDDLYAHRIGAGGQRSVECNHVAFAQRAARRAVVDVQAAGDHESVGRVVGETGRQTVASRAPRGALSGGLALAAGLGELSLHLVGHHLFDLIAHLHLVLALLGGVGVGGDRGAVRHALLIGGRQRGGEQVVGQPEGGAAVHGVGLEVTAIKAEPGRADAPAPAVRHGPRPGVVGPAIEGRPVKARADVVRVGVAVIVIRLIEASAADAVHDVGALDVGPIANRERMLHVAAAASVVDDDGVVGAIHDDRPPAVIVVDDGRSRRRVHDSGRAVGAEAG